MAPEPVWLGQTAPKGGWVRYRKETKTKSTTKQTTTKHRVKPLPSIRYSEKVTRGTSQMHKEPS